MKRKLILGLVVAIFLFSVIAVQPVKAECPDIVEVYHSSTPDDRINVGSPGVINWKLRWLGNKTEIINGCMLILVVGADVEALLYAHYCYDSWQLRYTASKVVQLEFSIFCVDCHGVTKFEQTAENVTIVWDSLDVTVTNETTTDIDGIIPLIRIMLLAVIIGEVCVIIILIIAIKRDG